MTIQDFRKKANKLIFQRQHLIQTIKDLKKKVEESKESVQVAEEGQKIVQEVAQSVQNYVHTQISQVVTRCLEAVFPDPYEFKIEFEMKRGKTECRVLFLRSGKEVNPMRAASGGVKDVASLALRLACLALSKPRKRRLLVLDEPFPGVDENSCGMLTQLLETLSEEMNLQIVLVSHNPDFQIGKVIRI